MLPYSSWAVLLSTIAACRSGQKAWLLTDAVVTMMFGTSLLVTPKLLLLRQTNIQLDSVSIHMTRVVGLLLLSSSLVSHRAFSSNDRRERYIVFLSRAVTALLFVLISLYGRIHYPEWNAHFLHISVTGAIFWMLPHMFYAVTSLPAGRNETLRASAFLIIEFFCTIAIGLAWFGFPQGLLRMQAKLRPNSVSVTIGRFLGALLIGNAFCSLLASALCALTTKRYLYSTKAISSAILVVVVILGHSWGQDFFACHILLGSCAAVMWGVNSAMGSLSTSHAKIGSIEKKNRCLSTIEAPDSVSINSHSYNLNMPSAKATTACFHKRARFDSLGH